MGYTARAPGTLGGTRKRPGAISLAPGRSGPLAAAAAAAPSAPAAAIVVLLVAARLLLPLASAAASSCARPARPGPPQRGALLQLPSLSGTAGPLFTDRQRRLRNQHSVIGQSHRIIGTVAGMHTACPVT